MMEISNNGAMNFFAQTMKTQGIVKASEARTAAQTLPEQANVAATMKAGNSNFTPTEAVQKEASKWETFAANELESIQGDIRRFNYAKGKDDAYWTEMEEIHGPEYVVIAKERDRRTIANMDDRLAYHEQRLTDNGFNITGTLAQVNDVGNYEFGDFTISKKGVGYDLLFSGPNDSEIEYTRGRGRAPNVLVDNKLQDLLFKESRRQNFSIIYSPQTDIIFLKRTTTQPKELLVQRLHILNRTDHGRMLHTIKNKEQV